MKEESDETEENGIDGGAVFESGGYDGDRARRSPDMGRELGELLDSFISVFSS